MKPLLNFILFLFCIGTFSVSMNAQARAQMPTGENLILYTSQDFIEGAHSDKKSTTNINNRRLLDSFNESRLQSPYGADKSWVFLEGETNDQGRFSMDHQWGDRIIGIIASVQAENNSWYSFDRFANSRHRSFVAYNRQTVSGAVGGLAKRPVRVLACIRDAKLLSGQCDATGRFSISHSYGDNIAGVIVSVQANNQSWYCYDMNQGNRNVVAFNRNSVNGEIASLKNRPVRVLVFTKNDKLIRGQSNANGRFSLSHNNGQKLLGVVASVQAKRGNQSWYTFDTRNTKAHRTFSAFNHSQISGNGSLTNEPVQVIGLTALDVMPVAVRASNNGRGRTLIHMDPKAVVDQRGDNSCGPNTLARMLNAYGYMVSKDETERIVLTIGDFYRDLDVGTPPDVMRDALSYWRPDARLEQRTSLNRILDLVSQGRPVATLLGGKDVWVAGDVPTYLHWVTVRGIDREKKQIHIADTKGFRWRTMSFSEFQGWWDFSINGIPGAFLKSQSVKPRTIVYCNGQLPAPLNNQQRIDRIKKLLGSTALEAEEFEILKLLGHLKPQDFFKVVAGVGGLSRIDDSVDGEEWDYLLNVIVDEKGKQLSLEGKIYLIKGLMDTTTGDGEERTINTLFETMSPPEFSEAVRRLGGLSAVDDDIDGSEWKTTLNIVVQKSKSLPMKDKLSFIKGLFDTSTGDAEERAIINLVKLMSPAERRHMLQTPGFSKDDFDDEVDGSEWDELERLLNR